MSSLCDLIALILFSTVLLFGKEAKFSCLGLFRSTTDEAPFGVVLVRLIGVDSSSLSLGFVTPGLGEELDVVHLVSASCSFSDGGDIFVLRRGLLCPLLVIHCSHLLLIRGVGRESSKD